ncbi:hypothetical protein C8F04DRAFT_1235806 [Mycena alexandri]|uniref:Uncharacterized protein n=1 Tax=Mycena alexandri TaxID=1745969 RepID=A0AAD6SPJ4_9AGAR|nr:hypothetical protein C8F04DRAFT_1235806 [Mycena alexandri]
MEAGLEDFPPSIPSVSGTVVIEKTANLVYGRDWSIPPSLFSSVLTVPVQIEASDFYRREPVSRKRFALGQWEKLIDELNAFAEEHSMQCLVARNHRKPRQRRSHLFYRVTNGNWLNMASKFRVVCTKPHGAWRASSYHTDLNYAGSGEFPFDSIRSFGAIMIWVATTLHSASCAIFLAAPNFARKSYSLQRDTIGLVGQQDWPWHPETFPFAHHLGVAALEAVLVLMHATSGPDEEEILSAESSGNLDTMLNAREGFAAHGGPIWRVKSP